jgi:hypothetical protein
MPTLAPDLAAAEQFLATHARVLDRRRFERLFQNGPAEAIRDAVAAYANVDGGFGHALESDGRAPGSQPAALALALRTLDEADAWDEALVARACAWLERSAPARGGACFVDPAIEGWPHAPWWQPEPDGPASLVTSGPIAGALHAREVDHPWLERASEILWERIDALEAPGSRARAAARVDRPPGVRRRHDRGVLGRARRGTARRRRLDLRLAGPVAGRRGRVARLGDRRRARGATRLRVLGLAALLGAARCAEADELVAAVAERAHARLAAAAERDDLAVALDLAPVLVDEPERPADEQRTVAVRGDDRLLAGHGAVLPANAAQRTARFDAVREPPAWRGR